MYESDEDGLLSLSNPWQGQGLARNPITSSYPAKNTEVEGSLEDGMILGMPFGQKPDHLFRPIKVAEPAGYFIDPDEYKRLLSFQQENEAIKKKNEGMQADIKSLMRQATDLIEERDKARRDVNNWQGWHRVKEIDLEKSQVALKNVKDRFDELQQELDAAIDLLEDIRAGEMSLSMCRAAAGRFLEGLGEED